jgi:hypothetical protein
MNRTVVFFLFPAILFLVGCRKTAFPTGEITEVSVLQQIERKTADKSGDAAIGALVGGALTGGLGGAVIGAGVGASGNKVVVEELVSCRMKVVLPDGKNLVLFFDHYNRNAEECALFKKGDKVKIGEVIFNNGSAVYSWKRTVATIDSQ